VSKPLLDKLIARIAAEGPLPLNAYMAECLLDPQHGYYATREPFGRMGDFITAPEVSQMFGELLGLWVADFWQRTGAPAKAYLVELGPGRGTMMRDALRALNALPAARAALHPVLMEASARLTQMQRDTLKGEEALWCTELGALPQDAPLFILANEFLDALPIRQFQMQRGQWHERCVDADPARKALRFVLAPEGLPRDLFGPAPEGTIAESAPAARAAIQEIAARLKAQGGAALFIDYGYAAGMGDTFQALRAKQFADPLKFPGEADLTAHVDFAALAQTARQAGIGVYGPAPQGVFLEALGLAARAESLKRNAAPAQRNAIDTARHRLTAAEAMGNLFLVLGLAPIGAVPPAGFPLPAA